MKPLKPESSDAEFLAMAKLPQDEWRISAIIGDDKAWKKFMRLAGIYSPSRPKKADAIDQPITVSVRADDSLQAWKVIPSECDGLYTPTKDGAADFLVPADYSEYGAAQRLAALARGHVVYNLVRSEWLVWSGSRWVPLKESLPSQLFSLVAAVSLMVKAEVNSSKVDEKTAAVGKPKQLRAGTGSLHMMTDIIKLATSEQFLGRSIDNYNNEKGILNVKNGEVSLSTGELLPHNPEHFFTKVAPVSYKPDAKAPIFSRFLDTTFNRDSQFVDWMQLLLGDSLRGVNVDQPFYVFFGEHGREGKSVLTNAISRVLGYKKGDNSGFSTPADVKIFLRSSFSGSGEAPTPGMARLDGSRFVTTTEPSIGDRFSEGIVKSLTGDDPVTVRELRKSSFTMFPQFTIVINANTIPSSDGSSAVMRRLVIVPFSHRVREGSLEDDPELPSELWNEREGILAWLVSGAVKAAKKREQSRKEKAEIREKIKSGELKTAPVVYEDPLKPFPSSVRQALLQYQFGANSATAFIFDALLGKRELWNWLSSTVWSIPATSGQDGYDRYFNRDGSFKDSAGPELFATPTLVFDAKASVSKAELYRLYSIWCKQNGYNRPQGSRAFNTTVKAFFKESRTSRGSVWLGLGAMPYFDPATRKLHRGEYGPVIGGIASDIVGGEDIDPEKRIVTLEPAIFQQLSKAKQEQVAAFIEKNGSSAYAGKYADATVALQDPMHPEIDVASYEGE